MSTRDRSVSQSDDLMKILAIIEEIEEKSADGDYIFRGEQEQYPKVSSGLYRLYVEEGGIDVNNFDGLQREILLEAKNYTAQRDPIEILTDIQHFGGKTNLIDFTTDHFVALFFACNGSYDKDGRLVLLRNREGKDFRIVSPPESNNRVTDQKSIFVLPKWGFVLAPVQVTIPATLKRPLLRHLRREQRVTDRTIYNDLHGFIRNQPNYRDAIVKYLDGYVCLEEEDSPRAIRHYTEALDLRPEYAEALNNRGVLFSRQEKYAEALYDLDEAIDINPKYVEAFNNRGAVKYERGQYEEALSDYNEAIAINPKYAEAFNNRGAVKSRLGRHTEALSDYDRALDYKPQYAEAHVGRGIVKIRLSLYTKAIIDFEKALDICPKYAEAYFNRGNAKEGLRQYREAIADYDETIRIDPKHVKAFSNRGLAKIRLAQFEPAIDDLSMATALDSKYVDAWVGRGVARRLTGQFKEAVLDFDEAILIDPKHAKAYLNRAMTLKSLNCLSAARKDYVRAQTLARQQGYTEILEVVSRELDNLE